MYNVLIWKEYDSMINQSNEEVVAFLELVNRIDKMSKEETYSLMMKHGLSPDKFTNMEEVRSKILIMELNSFKKGSDLSHLTNGNKILLAK
jgi:hypothetical protein